MPKILGMPPEPLEKWLPRLGPVPDPFKSDKDKLCTCKATLENVLDYFIANHPDAITLASDRKSVLDGCTTYEASPWQGGTCLDNNGPNSPNFCMKVVYKNTCSNLDGECCLCFQKTKCQGIKSNKLMQEAIACMQAVDALTGKYGLSVFKKWWSKCS